MNTRIIEDRLALLTPQIWTNSGDPGLRPLYTWAISFPSHLKDSIVGFLVRLVQGAITWQSHDLQGLPNVEGCYPSLMTDAEDNLLQDF